MEETVSETRASETRLRVRYAETDQMGVVYYANYLVWMEIARTDFCIAAGFRYRDLEVDERVAIAVAEAHCRYRSPARYDDDLVIRTRLEHLRRRTLRFGYEISNARSGERLADGYTIHVVVGTEEPRSRSLPDAYLEKLRPWVVVPVPAATKKV
jgi:acyl-CoA thioester hydrolase